jgi:hypothetical protein
MIEMCPLTMNNNIRLTYVYQLFPIMLKQQSPIMLKQTKKNFMSGMILLGGISFCPLHHGKLKLCLPGE